MKIFKDRAQGLLFLEIFFHVLFWCWFFASVNVSWTSGWMLRSEREGFLAPLTFVLYPLAFYFNFLYLIPKFLKGKRWWLYFLVALASVLFIEVLRCGIFISSLKYEGDFFSQFKQEFISGDNLIMGGPNSLFLPFTLSFAYRITRDWVTNGRLIEQLKAEKTIAELNALKSQINPHFLFNNLNALDDLIDRDKDQAKEYLHKMSSIFRYSIVNMESDIVILKEEWDYMQDYIFLLKERFGKAYQFEIINDQVDLYDYFIPPAALQGLIENVIKHNQASLDDPLKTSIELTPLGIVVKHKKRLKVDVVGSLGTGLENLRARYRLLSDKEIEIQDDQEFMVRLPLIEQSNEE